LKDAASLKSRVKDIKTKVSQQVTQEHKSEKNLGRLNRDVARDEQRQLYELKKSNARRNEGDWFADEGDEGDEPEEEEEEEQEEEEGGKDPIVEITTILLTFLGDPPLLKSGRKSKKKQASYAMTLWADGPAVTPVINFNHDRRIMNEYNLAADRGADECGCNMCQGTRLSVKQHDLHLGWHRKYRLYFALRTVKFPDLKDMDAERNWTKALEDRMLADLVELWKQVDADAPPPAT
jgi:hypothetical protein